MVIVGGGLTGLAAAHRLVSRASAARTADRGGRPRGQGPGRRGRSGPTGRTGSSLEGGADSFITNKPWALDLCRELGLGDQLIGTDDRNRRSFVVRNGRLLPVPEGFVLMAPAGSARS